MLVNIYLGIRIVVHTVAICIYIVLNFFVVNIIGTRSIIESKLSTSEHAFILYLPIIRFLIIINFI